MKITKLIVLALSLEASMLRSLTGKNEYALSDAMLPQIVGELLAPETYEKLVSAFGLKFKNRVAGFIKDLLSSDELLPTDRVISETSAKVATNLYNHLENVELVHKTLRGWLVHLLDPSIAPFRPVQTVPKFVQLDKKYRDTGAELITFEIPNSEDSISIPLSSYYAILTDELENFADYMPATLVQETGGYTLQNVEEDSEMLGELKNFLQSEILFRWIRRKAENSTTTTPAPVSSVTEKTQSRSDDVTKEEKNVFSAQFVSPSSVDYAAANTANALALTKGSEPAAAPRATYDK